MKTSRWKVAGISCAADGGKRLLRGCILPLVLATLHLLPVRCLSAESVRTLALADFAVRTPEHQGAGSSWLGPAVSELLQAKLQLFGGARVLERLRALLREAKAGAGAALDDPTALVGVVPAEVLIAGSVSVDPKDPRRIRVQARAFEVETSKIVSEAAFSGTGDLAGLLKIAEDLAKTLADGLKLSYTPEQLAYAEPAKIDTLRFFVDGEVHFTAGRHREAIASFQQALEGNEGRYYAAAHRLQGEAYQALAKASAGEQERQVREEYLKKFKEDALVASGALFDLGLACEANGMWKQALDAFGDYLRVIGPEGETVRWNLRLIEDLGLPDLTGRGSRRLNRVFLVKDRLHFVAEQEGRWFTIDTSTGSAVSDIPLARALGLTINSRQRYFASLLGVEESRAYVSWALSEGHPDWTSPVPPTRLSALDNDGKVLWTSSLEEEGSLLDAWCFGGRVFCLMRGHYNEGEPKEFALLTLDGQSGDILSRVVVPAMASQQDAALFGLDLARAALMRENGMLDLLDGSFVPFRKEGEPEPPGSRVRPPLERELPTPWSGITVQGTPVGQRILMDGAQKALLDKCRIVLDNPPLPSPGPLLCRNKDRGYSVLDPSSGAVHLLYGDFRAGNLPQLLAENDSLLVFGYEIDPRGNETDPQYSAPAKAGGTVLNVFSSRSGQLLAKHYIRAQVRNVRVLILGQDIVFALDFQGSIARLHLLSESVQNPVRAGEVYLHRATCLQELGDEDGMRQNLSLFESEFDQDPRGDLVRMRSASRRGDSEEASALALRVFSSGMIDDADIHACLDAIRDRHPEVRDAIMTPFKGTMTLVAMATPYVLVASPAGSRTSKINVLIDVASRSIRIVKTPDLPSHTIFAGRNAFALLLEGRILKVDLLSGERRQSQIFPVYRSDDTFIPGAAVAFQARAGSDSPPKPESIWFFDPESLEVAARLPFGAARFAKPRFTGSGLAVYAGVSPRDVNGQVTVAIVERGTGREAKRFTLEVDHEEVLGAVADHESVFITLRGWDNARIRSHSSRGSWMRVLALPLLPEGPAWEYEAEGYMAGNPVLEDDKVTFPAWEGRLPVPATDRLDRSAFRLDQPFPLRRISLDRRVGRRIGDLPLIEMPREKRSYIPLVCDGNSPASNIGTLFLPVAPRVIFPNREESIWGCDDPGNYWWFAPGHPPAHLLQYGPEQEYRVIGDQFGFSRFLSAADVVFESIGGGVILVKDFAGGKGMHALGPP